MKFTETEIPGVYAVEPAVFGDHRGFFMESWSKRAFEEAGLHYNFVQDNHSSSTVKGTLRGIHFQRGEKAQAKLVRCTRGAVLDVAVDLRPSSPTYKKWVAVELNAENKKQLLIPRGFGHGFVTLTDNVEFLYKADKAERIPTIRFWVLSAGISIGTLLKMDVFKLSIAAPTACFSTHPTVSGFYS